MDLNLIVIAGRLATKPEIRMFEGGSTLVRYLVTTRTEEPRRRIDVVPVVMWDASEENLDFERGDRIWVAGSIQRRFWSDDRGCRSQIQVVANHVQKNMDQAKLDQLAEDKSDDEAGETLEELDAKIAGMEREIEEAGL